MNARQRMLGTLRFEKIDRPFRWETPGIWPQTLARWVTEGLPAEIAADYGKLYEFLGYDRLDWVPATDWGAEPFWPKFERKILEDDGIHLTVRDTDGIIKKILKVNPELSMPQFLKFPVESMEDYEAKVAWRLDPDEDKRFPDGWLSKGAEFTKRDYPIGLFIVGPFGHVRNLMGDEMMMYAFYDAPELIALILNRWRDFYTDFITKVCRIAVPEMIMVWEDNCYKNGPLISPDLFRKIMLPGLADVIRHAKSFGVEGICVDTDGDCHKLLPVYLDAGVNAFYPFECKAGMDIVKLRKQYGKKFASIGGIEKFTLSDQMTEKDMTEEIDRKVTPMFELGGYIPMLDHSAPPNISYKRFMRFLEYIRELPKKYK